MRVIEARLHNCVPVHLILAAVFYRAMDGCALLRSIPEGLVQSHDHDLRVQQERMALLCKIQTRIYLKEFLLCDYFLQGFVKSIHLKKCRVYMGNGQSLSFIDRYNKIQKKESLQEQFKGPGLSLTCSSAVLFWRKVFEL